MKRALRLLQIIELLKQNRRNHYTTSGLASRFDVSQRTIQRDLDELRGEPEYLPLVSRVRREWTVETVGETGEQDDRN